MLIQGSMLIKGTAGGRKEGMGASASASSVTYAKATKNNKLRHIGRIKQRNLFLAGINRNTPFCMISFSSISTFKRISQKSLFKCKYKNVDKPGQRVSYMNLSCL
jgi:hypothetical protein